MKKILYKTSGTCSQYIELAADDDQCITTLNVIGGCSGNLKGIGTLVRGMKLDFVHDKLKGILCGDKATSCPDQISLAIEKLKQQY